MQTKQNITQTNLEIKVTQKNSQKLNHQNIKNKKITINKCKKRQIVLATMNRLKKKMNSKNKKEEGTREKEK